MKKISLLLVMMLAFTVSVVAQSLPKPLNPSVTDWIDNTPTVWPDGSYKVQSEVMLECGIDYMQNPVADDYPGNKAVFEAMDEGIFLEYTILDEDKVSYSIFTDNDKLFVLTAGMYPDLFEDVYPGLEEATRIPYAYEGGDIEYWFVHFPGLTNNVDVLAENGIQVEPFFTWRIGVQSYYTVDDQTSASDIVYMEIFPQMKEAAQVTSTSFLADWSCDAENTFMVNGFKQYDLYIINTETGDTVVINDIAPTNSFEGEWGNTEYLPGATYMVEGLTPGATYQYYVVSVGYYHTYKSVVREVTLPLNDVYMLGGDDQGWDCTDGSKKFVYDAENKVYTMTYTFPAENNYFGFTTALAENNDQGGWDYIEQFRFGAVANEGTNFIWYEDQHNGQPISMTWDAYHAIQIPGGEYKLTVNLTDMTLIIEKQYAPAERGDVNRDGAVNIADVTCLIDHLLSNDYTDSDNFSNFAAHVNDDASINIADVTALIDKLLSNN